MTTTGEYANKVTYNITSLNHRHPPTPTPQNTRTPLPNENTKHPSRNPHATASVRNFLCGASQNRIYGEDRWAKYKHLESREFVIDPNTTG